MKLLDNGVAMVVLTSSHLATKQPNRARKKSWKVKITQKMASKMQNKCFVLYQSHIQHTKIDEDYDS